MNLMNLMNLMKFKYIINLLNKLTKNNIYIKSCFMDSKVPCSRKNHQNEFSRNKTKSTCSGHLNHNLKIIFDFLILSIEK